MVRFFLLILIALGLSSCERVPVLDGAQRQVEDARARNDAPALWRVQDEDSTLYLFGTVHLLPNTLSWQRDDLREAFAEAGTVFFEADTEGAAGLRAQSLATQRGLRRDGMRLTETMDGYQSKLLEAVANNGNIDLAALDSMRPWLASEFIGLAAAADTGLSADLSADEALKSRARRSGKAIVYFETAEDQVRHMADLPEPVQLELLTEAMERFDQTGPQLEKIAYDWAVGDLDGLAAAISAPLKSAPDAYRDAVFTQRHDLWADRLDQFMDGAGTGFAAVGTAHLLGEDSLIAALEARGHDVSRYLAFLGEDVITPTPLELPDVPNADD